MAGAGEKLSAITRKTLEGTSGIRHPPITVRSYKETGGTVTTECNLVQQGQEIDTPGVANRIRTGDSDGEGEGLMPFACVMEDAQGMVPQKKGKAGNPDQPHPVTGKGIAQGPHKIPLNPGAKGPIRVEGKGLSDLGMVKGGRSERAHSPAGAEPGSPKTGSQRMGPRADGAGSKTAGMIAVKDEVLSKTRGTRVAGPSGKDIGIGKKIDAFGDGERVRRPNLSMTASKGEKNLFMTASKGEEMKAGAASLDDSPVLPQKGAKGPIGLTGGDLPGKDVLKGDTSKRGDPLAGVDPQSLRSGLKKGAATKGRIVVEKGGAKKASYAPARGDGKGDIGTQRGLKDETTVAVYERGKGTKSNDHTDISPRREVSPSAPASERHIPAGEYQQPPLNAAVRTAAIPENVGITHRALIDQIAGGAKISGRVRIALNPPSLGTLDVDVMVRDNKVHVVLQVENADVKQMLQSHMESLRGSFRSQGLVADTIQVFAQEKSDGGAYGSERNEPFFGQDNTSSRNERGWGGGNDLSDHTPPLPEEETPRVLSEGRVSVFA